MVRRARRREGKGPASGNRSAAATVVADHDTIIGMVSGRHLPNASHGPSPCYICDQRSCWWQAVGKRQAIGGDQAHVTALEPSEAAPVGAAVHSRVDYVVEGERSGGLDHEVVIEAGGADRNGCEACRMPDVLQRGNEAQQDDK